MSHAVTLYEPVTMFVILTALIMAVSGALFALLLTAHERDCHAANAALLIEERAGPLRAC